MADIRHFEKDGGHRPSWKSSNRHISTKNYWILMKFGSQQQIWNSMTVTWSIVTLKFKMADAAAILKIVFGHISAADCRNSVAFCVGKQFSIQFRQCDRYPRSNRTYFCFYNAVWASASGGFRIVSETPIHLFCTKGRFRNAHER